MGKMDAAGVEKLLPHELAPTRPKIEVGLQTRIPHSGLFSKSLYLSSTTSMKKNTYYLIIGSNLGDRVNQLTLAKKLIGQEVGALTAESSIYETQPWGYEDQPWFLNQVLKLDSTESPQQVLRKI